MSNPPPEHWSTLVGPANWFRLYHPPQWTTEERQGTFAIRPLDSDALLAINSIWIDEDREANLPGLQEIVSQFPETRNVVACQEVQFGAVEQVQGEAVLVPSRKWWERLITSGDWRSWTIWSFRREKLLLVVTLLHAAERDPELESIVRMMLASLEICDEPADPPEVFAQRALQLARSHFPLLDIQLDGEFGLRINGSKLNLQNFYRAYVREPERFTRILLPAFSTAVQIQGWGEQETSPPLDAVRDRIMPMLYPEALWREKFDGVHGSPWVAGLAVLYVIDESNAYWYVREDLLTAWNLTAEALHELALENLHRYFDETPMEMAVATSEAGTPTLMMPSRPETYNSVRLISESFRDRMREVAQSDLVIGAPGRDFFIAVSADSFDRLEEVRRQIVSDFRDSDHPLTDRLLFLSADGVSEYLEESA